MVPEKRNTTAAVLFLAAGVGAEALLLWLFLSHQAFAYSAQEVREYFWKLSRPAFIPLVAFVAAVPFVHRREPRRLLAAVLGFVGVGIGALLLAFLLVHNGAAVLFLGWCAQLALATTIWTRLRPAA